MKKVFLLAIFTLMVSGLGHADSSKCPQEVHQPIVIEPVSILR